MYRILLCLRYLKTRYIALASIISVMLGVATMIVVNSVMAGFATEMRSRIHGILADVIIETNSLDGVEDAQGHLELVRQAAGTHIAGMTATVEIYGMLSFQYAGQWITRPVTLIGIQPQEKATVGPLVDYLQSYQDLTEHDAKSGRVTVIRKALRPREQLPSWELTEEARQHRSGWVLRAQWLNQRLSPAHALAESGRPKLIGPHVPASFEREQAAQRAQPPDFEDPPARDGEDSLDDPFGVQPEGPAVESLPSSTEPLEGRLYVGLGLISFPYEDKNGTVKTMMMVRPGDDVKISTVTAGRPPNPVHFNATIVDAFKSGMSEYDSNLVFCNLEYLQKIRGMVDPTTGMRSITSIQIRLKDFGESETVVEKLRAVFPPGIYSVRTWEQKQGPLLAAVDVESAILNVLLFLIIAVAGFGILAIFFMIVVEKTRDIGILKALGASSRGVMSIFLSYGLALGIVGSGVGVVLGLLFVRYINVIESWITFILGRKVFDERIYYFPEIPTAVNPWMVVWVAIGAMTIAVLASVLPARRAARLHPVEALRYE